MVAVGAEIELGWDGCVLCMELLSILVVAVAVIVGWDCPVMMPVVGAELEGEDIELIVEVPLLLLVVFAGDGSIVPFITMATTTDVETKVLFPIIPSHITWHELALNDVGTLSQSRRSFPKT